MVDNRNENNIVLAGLPRSGTTLTCHLLNEVPDTVALGEPMDVAQFGMMKNAQERTNAVSNFFMEQRFSLLSQSVARSKVVNGKVPDNTAGQIRTERGYRRTIATLDLMKVDKPLSSKFTLVVKHPSAFTAMLGELKQKFQCFAVVRNPLSVLASWNSVDMPINNGHVPAAEQIDQALASMLAQTVDKSARQIFLLSWFFGQYKKHLADKRIIRYEDVISTKGECLRCITENVVSSSFRATLYSKNRNRLYDANSVIRLGETLLQSDGAYWDFYSKSDVENVLSSYSSKSEDRSL